ncbi:MAG: hypothetical protein J1F63_02160 [Oscillospiraceae bacterium]|nr:hypothetical protein [Oscillospiraceae bacterium]
MPKRIELLPKADIGRAYAIVEENGVEIRVSGVMGALKAWLVGGESRPIGNIVGGRLMREVDTSGHSGILITQSGRQMFYGSWQSEAEQSSTERPETEQTSFIEQLPPPVPEPEKQYAPLPDFGWEKITGRDFPSTDERVRFALSTRAFFEAFKKHGYYLFGRDGEKFALAVKRLEGKSPFPNIEKTEEAGEFSYVVL